MSEIACKARNTIYDPRRNAAVLMRLKKPDVTGQIHRTGKVLILGAKNEKQSYEGARRIARIIQKIGFPVFFSDFKVHNVMCDARFGFAVNLSKIEREWSDFCQYDPEISNQLYFKLTDPKVTLTLYYCGKVTAVGAKSFKDSEEAIKWICPIIHSAKMRRPV